MYFFFDESGDFSLPRDGEHRAGVVAGIAVPDHIAPALEKQYRDFASTLEKNERANGEPKGSLLCYEHRKAFGEMMGRFIYKIAFTPFTFDLSSLEGNQAEPKEKMVDSLMAWIPRMKHEGPRERMKLLAKQLENLSTPQVHRLFSIANAFRESIAAAVTFLATGPNESSWEKLSFEVDRFTKQPNSRYEQVFSGLIGGWLYGWSELHPLQLITEIHSPDLLLLRKYGTDGALKLTTMLHGNIHWKNSAENWGIQLADISANIVADAVRNSESPRSVRPFVKLMRACPFPFQRGPGLLVGDKTKTHVLKRYDPLARALAEDQRRSERVAARRIGF